MSINYSLHKITNVESFSFCPAQYSRFKFGDDKVAEAFGTSLAKGFIREHLSTRAIEQQIVVVSSPYAFIPTATFAMKNYFVYTLNQWLVKNNFPVVQETKIHRTITYKEDYGELNATERMRLIGNDAFHIDRIFLENKAIIFLDDIRITGSHERMIHKMIHEHGLINDIYLLYFAELVNLSIHPNVENYLNYFEVKSIFDLVDIICNKRFSINTRLVKYLLNAESTSFLLFIQKMDTHFLQLLYNMALGNSYHLIEWYQTNLGIVEGLLSNQPIEISNT